MKKLPAIIPGEGVRTQRETIYKRPVNRKIVAQRGFGSSVKSVIKKGVKFGLAGLSAMDPANYQLEAARWYVDKQAKPANVPAGCGLVQVNWASDSNYNTTLNQIEPQAILTAKIINRVEVQYVK